MSMSAQLSPRLEPVSISTDVRVEGNKLFQIANQLRVAPNLSLYGEKILFACSRTSSGVIEWTSTLPPDSAKVGSLANLEAAMGPV